MMSSNHSMPGMGGGHNMTGAHNMTGGHNMTGDHAGHNMTGGHAGHNMTGGHDGHGGAAHGMAVCVLFKSFRVAFVAFLHVSFI